ncbi:MAG: hypothetical protein IJP12_03810 [Methanobrevibacter sp.]|nr:hypothetical protein [Methanobrevibacter sp.]
MCAVSFDKEETQFVKFLEYYSNYYKESHKIAENKDGETILPNTKGKNQFKMYSLDDICQSCSKFKEGKLLFTPKTTDAIWYKKSKKGNFFIFLIEFKGDYLCKHSSKCALIDVLDTLKIKNKDYNNIFNNEVKSIERVISKYSDKLLNGLASKPLETVTIALPIIYEDYYEKNKDKEDVEHIDIKNFLEKSKIIYRVVSISEKYEPNRQRSRGRAYRCSNIIPTACQKYAKNEDDIEPVISYESSLKTYYKRYIKAGILSGADFIENTEFDNFTKKYLK